MDVCVSTTSHLQSTERIGQGAIGGESQGQSPLTASIHILDDDSLLNVFYLYRPFLLGEDENEDNRLIGGKRGWVRGRWWYNLAHVCQRWRNAILGSASYLGVTLVCTNGTPIADMLTYSPPLPLVIDYQFNDFDEGVILALKQYDRVRRVRLFRLPATTLQKLVAAMDGEYPILEYLIIGHLERDQSSSLIFPETLQAPRLRHLALIGFALPIGSRLLATAVDLVTLYLLMTHPSTYFHPNTLLQWLSSMPQLETLIFVFIFPVPNSDGGDIERQLTHTPIMTDIMLPNLHRLAFQGVGNYLEAIIHRITAPRLEKLQVIIFNQLPFSAPRILQFVNTTESLRFKSAKFEFSDKKFGVEVHPDEEAETYALSLVVDSCHDLDRQVSFAAHISNSLSPRLSAVKYLTLGHSVHNRSSEEHNEANPTEWRKLLKPFMNVKTLCIAERLVEELSRSLELDDGELSLELLPELQELTYSGSGNTGDMFTSFIDARQDAGRSITLVRRSPSPDPNLSMSSTETSSDTTERGEAASDPDI